MVIFSKTNKKIISQQTRKGPYIFDVHVNGRWEWWVLKFVTCLQIFLIFLKKIYCSFLQMEGAGVAQLVIFCGGNKWFKLTND